MAAEYAARATDQSQDVPQAPRHTQDVSYSKFFRVKSIRRSQHIIMTIYGSTDVAIGIRDGSLETKAPAQDDPLLGKKNRNVCVTSKSEEG